MHVIHVHVHVLADAVEAFRQATFVNAERSLNKPGVARFDVIQQQDDPTRFVLVEVYRTAEAISGTAFAQPSPKMMRFAVANSKPATVTVHPAAC